MVRGGGGGGFIFYNFSGYIKKIKILIGVKNFNFIAIILNERNDNYIFGSWVISHSRNWEYFFHLLHESHTVYKQLSMNSLKNSDS